MKKFSWLFSMSSLYQQRNRSSLANLHPFHLHFVSKRCSQYKPNLGLVCKENFYWKKTNIFCSVDVPPGFDSLATFFPIGKLRIGVSASCTFPSIENRKIPNEHWKLFYASTQYIIQVLTKIESNSKEILFFIFQRKCRTDNKNQM